MKILAALPSLSDRLKERLKTDNGNAGFNHASDPNEVLQHINSHDPSNGSYKPWLTKTYLNGGIRHLEDLSRAKHALKLFHNNKHKLEHKDINHYKTLPELETAVAPHDKSSEGSKSNWSEKGRDLINQGQAKLLHNDKDYHIVQPKTKEASQHFGINTKWCTAATEGKNYFNDYNTKGKLTYVLHKPSNKRFAFFEPKLTKSKRDIDYVGTEPEAFDETDSSLDPMIFAKEHPKATDVIAKHFNPLNSYWLGRKTKINSRYFTPQGVQARTKMSKAIKSTDNEKHLDALLDDPDTQSWAKIEIANRGNPNHIARLVNDPEPMVRESAVKHATKEQLDKLVHDYDRDVRNEVARQGNPEHLDKLVNDPDTIVRLAVATHGTKEHRDRLLDNILNKPDKNLGSNWFITQEIARHQDPEHLDRLIKYPHPEVRATIAKYGGEKQHDQLVHDYSPAVRRFVARYGSDKHREQLMNDLDPNVKNTVAKNLKDKNLLLKLRELEYRPHGYSEASRIANERLRKEFGHEN